MPWVPQGPAGPSARFLPIFPFACEKRGLEQDVLGVPPSSHVAETKMEARRGAGSHVLPLHWGRPVKDLETGGGPGFTGQIEKQQK